MQYDVKNPEEYLEVLDADWRKDKLLEIRRMILEYGPELEESIKYKMLSYDGGDEAILALNAQKSYVSLYVGTIDKVENASTLLEPFDTGKGCIRVRKSVDIHNTGLEQFIKTTIDLWRSGGDTSC
ncbi:MAG: DUF1801 domain-containing protein [Limnochordia bacterium]|jgi:uncharacterized protein YdhG (YjbR/CyaY superfamily)|nr:DUF1801 domain-containing protein [Limnochordia bacterium]